MTRVEGERGAARARGGWLAGCRLGIALSLAACSVPAVDQEPAPRPRQPQQPAAKTADHRSVEAANPQIGLRAFYAVASLTYDTDLGENPPNQELDSGDGYALQLSLGNVVPETDAGTRVSVAAEYARFEHDELRTGTRAELHYGTLLCGIEPVRWGGRVFACAPRLLLGLGGLVIDHAPTGPDDTGGALAALGGELDVRLFGHISLTAGVRWQIIGFPGETIADGGAAMVGGGVVF